MDLKFALLICLAKLSAAEDDNKWVWKSGDRRSGGPEGIRGSHNVGKPRYEVIEDDAFRPSDFRPPPDFDRPGRPIGIHQEPGFPDGPFPNRPGLGPFVPNERPGGFGVPGGHRPPGGFHPGGSDQGILTGPVPSWEREPPYKHFDRCKCSEKFNCNSPGISYGQCDVGKQYCCYNSKKESLLGGPLPSRPIHSPENGVLVGPGGPFDGPGGPGGYPGGPHRPYPRPPHYGDNGILVGPGGPAGIGRPPNRPFGGNIHSPEFGVLVGPGGPHDGPHGPFRPPGPFGYRGRSGNKSTKDDVK